MPEYKIVDSIMGSGKSLAIINNLLKQHDDRKYLIVVPLLSEVTRYQKALDLTYEVPKPVRPLYKNGKSKLSDLKELLRHKARRVITTHANFEMIDNETIELLRDGGYNLVLDEVPQPSVQVQINKYDFRNLVSGGSVLLNEETGALTWNPDEKDYNGMFSDFKNLCLSDRLFYFKDFDAVMKIFPYKAFDACSIIWILTYMFESQIMYYYLKQHGATYQKYSAVFDSWEGEDQYLFYPYDKSWDRIYDLKNLIHICDNKKMNSVGKNPYALSHAWFNDKENNKDSIIALRKNTTNFCKNIVKAKSNDCLWTTFLSEKDELKGFGYSNGFLSLTTKATNEYADRHCVAYLVNRFISPITANMYCISEEDKFDQDAFAISEMVQFIWRSAIRKSEPIDIYIPSKRMRDLLESWIEENTKREHHPDPEEIDRIFNGF